MVSRRRSNTATTAITLANGSQPQVPLVMSIESATQLHQFIALARRQTVSVPGTHASPVAMVAHSGVSGVTVVAVGRRVGVAHSTALWACASVTARAGLREPSQAAD